VNTSPALRPRRIPLHGRYIHVVPLEPNAHADALWIATRSADDVWTYLADGPYADRETFQAALENKAASEDSIFFAMIDIRFNAAAGYAAYMRIEPAHRVIEVGNILFTPALQRTAGATEAMYLMARHAFEDLGYRRYEWKCNARNAPSRAAALRLGFTFEGIFRQHMIVKGQNRDTAWFSMLDCEWPERKAAFERWLDPANFDQRGQQIRRLSEFMRLHDNGDNVPA